MVKEKSNQSRVFDSEGYRKRAACICVKSEEETEVKSIKMFIEPTNKKK